MANQVPATQPEEFSLAGAIFIPFEGIPESVEVDPSSEKNLKTVLESLDRSKDDVKQNMVFLARLKQEKILQEAEETLRKEERDDSCRSRREKGYEIEREALLQRMKRARKSSKDSRTGGDVEMSGMDSSTIAPKSTSELVGRKLEALFESSFKELDAYDAFMEQQKVKARDEIAQQQINKIKEAAQHKIAARRPSAPTGPSGGANPIATNAYMPERSKSFPSPSNFNTEDRRPPAHNDDPFWHLEPRYKDPDQWGASATNASANPGRQTYGQSSSYHNVNHGPPHAPPRGPKMMRDKKDHPRTHIFTCMYWLRGDCFRGDSCTYRHDRLGEDPPGMV